MVQKYLMTDAKCKKPEFNWLHSKKIKIDRLITVCEDAHASVEETDKEEEDSQVQTGVM